MKIDAVSKGLRPLLKQTIARSFHDFIGAEVDRISEVAEGYLDQKTRLCLPAGIYSQVGFGNSVAEGALILCAQPDTFHKISPWMIPKGNLKLAADILGELSNLMGGLMLNERLFKDPYDSFALAPPVKFENKGEVKYFANAQGLNLLFKLEFTGTIVLCGLLLREREPFYVQYPTDDCNPITE